MQEKINSEKEIPATKENLQKLVGKEFFLLYMSKKEVDRAREKEKKFLRGETENSLWKKGGYANEINRIESHAVYIGKLGIPISEITEENGDEIEFEDGSFFIDITNANNEDNMILEANLYRICPAIIKKIESSKKKVYLKIQGLVEHPWLEECLKFLG